MSEVLAGRVALVTGAGRDIGRGIAVEFARDGAKVVVASRSPGPIAATVREIEAFGGTAIPVQYDIADKQSILDTVARSVDACGGHACRSPVRS